MIKRITGVTAKANLRGRDVEVVFRSPYLWRIYENGADVTASFGHSLRGDPIPRDTPEWKAWHDEVEAGTYRQVFEIVV